MIITERLDEGAHRPITPAAAVPAVAHPAREDEIRPRQGEQHHMEPKKAATKVAAAPTAPLSWQARHNSTAGMSTDKRLSDPVRSAASAKVTSDKDGRTSDRAVVAAAKSAERPGAAAARNRDTDVVLLEALVSHVSGSAPKNASPEASRRASSEIIKDNGQAVASSTAAVAHSGEPSRDIVLRNTQVRTQDLITRCRALGFLEGELCRMRICSGRWGTDPACPVSRPAGE